MALGGRGSDSKIGWQHEEKGIYMGGFDVSHSQIYATDDQNNATEGDFNTVHCRALCRTVMI